jgi:hypothetical protein
MVCSWLFCTVRWCDMRYFVYTVVRFWPFLSYVFSVTEHCTYFITCSLLLYVDASA